MVSLLMHHYPINLKVTDTSAQSKLLISPTTQLEINNEIVTSLSTVFSMVKELKIVLRLGVLAILYVFIEPVLRNMEHRSSFM